MTKKVTTIKIDEEVYKAAKKRAVDMNLTVSELIEKAIRRELRMR